MSNRWKIKNDPFLEEALSWDVRNVQGRGEHEDMPDNQDKVAAGVGGEWLACGRRLRDGMGCCF